MKTVGIEEWMNFKSRLVESSPWLEPIVAPLCLQVSDAIREHPLPVRAFNPYFYESLIRDSISLVEQCLSYRREAHDLEIQAVRFATDFAKFLELFDVNIASEVFPLALERLHSEKAGAEKTALAFRKDSSVLSQGFCQEAEGRVSALAVAIDLATKQESMIGKKWQVLRGFEEAAQVRFSTKGNGHNFVDRLSRIVRFLAEDVQEAAAKAKAAFLGVFRVYGEKFAVPDLYSDSFLDDFAIELRRVARFLEWESMNDSAYDLVVPLAQPWLERDGQSFSLVDSSQLIEGFRTGREIDVDMRPVFFEQSKVRLRSVGVSFGAPLTKDYDDPALVTHMSAFRLRAELGLPEPDEDASRASIFFGDVRVFSGASGLATYDGAMCRNIDPRGIWSVKFQVATVHSSSVRTILDTEHEKLDVKLHLSVVAQFDRNTRLPRSSGKSASLGPE